MEQGVTVAVLDTGIGRHPDIAGKLLCFHDFVKQRKLMYDNNGHGTHVCGILCGSGGLSEGKYRGIAPNTRLVVGKVLDEKGDGMAENMLWGLDWVLENRHRYGIRILNISVGIGSLNHTEKENALREKIETLWNSGIVVVCAAGNKGPEDGSISSVGSCDKVITVGCHDGDYGKSNGKRCETYSGRGLSGAVIRKPDIVAPGTEIMSCNVRYQKAYGRIRNAYVEKSGTSMATPIVSGAIALLLQKYPWLDNESIKERLIYCATDLGEPWNKQGWGMVNVRRMLEYAEPRNS
jgi:serine protease AprX